MALPEPRALTALPARTASTALPEPRALTALPARTALTVLPEPRALTALPARTASTASDPGKRVDGKDGGVDGATFNSWRAGVATVPAGTATVGTVTFSSSIGSTTYAVSIEQVGTGSTGGASSGCVWHVESRTATAFTYSCRSANNGTAVDFTNGTQILYTAMPAN